MISELAATRRSLLDRYVPKVLLSGVCNRFLPHTQENLSIPESKIDSASVPEKVGPSNRGRICTAPLALDTILQRIDHCLAAV